MLGAIIGDIVGSRYESFNIKWKDFELFSDELCCPTDDTIMTLAIADAVTDCRKYHDYEHLEYAAIIKMRLYGRVYPNAGYGRRFYDWIWSDIPKPYESYGNGAVMRVSPCGFAAKSLEEAEQMAEAVTKVTHNHPDAIQAAKTIAGVIFLGKSGRSKVDLRTYFEKNYRTIDFTLNDIRKDYSFDVSCSGSVPQAFEAFYEAVNFEDAIRNAISIGGDSDTIAAITGSIAETYYEIPKDISKHAMKFLDKRQKKILTTFEKEFQQG